SMDAVAIQAGVTKQTVYRYYPSKETLFVAVMEKIRTEEAPPYDFGSGNLTQELRNFGKQLLAFHLTPSALGVYKMMLTEGGQENLLKPFMDAGPTRVMQPLMAFLQQRCEALDDVAFHAQMFATMILSPRNQRMMSSKEPINKAAQEKHVHKVVQLFLKGLDR
ncbi:MAG: TetR/AcrR family transcriptional regulator, partial [Gammaproteobacteria bacterium]|nr:TetR/AcrR family transcriptional regulator [Gammaproteobacteria bacterium]